MNKYDYLIKHFNNAKAPYGEQYVASPFKQGQYVYATDAKILIIIPVGLLTLSYPESKEADIKVPNFEKFHLEFTQKMTSITMLGLETLFAKLPNMIVEHKVKNNSTFYKKKFEGEISEKTSYVELNGMFFNPCYIDLVLQAMLITGENEITIKSGGERLPIIFVFNRIEISLMPVML
jgi:hypothetical protein